MDQGRAPVETRPLTNGHKVNVSMRRKRTVGKIQRCLPLVVLLLTPWVVPAWAKEGTGNKPGQSEFKASELGKDSHWLMAQSAGNNASELNEQAQASFDKGDFPNAIALWTQIILGAQSQNTLNEILASRAKAYLVINQPMLALDDLNKIAVPASHSADLASLWLLKGVALLQMGRNNEAVQAFNTSERMAKGNAILFANRAVALQSLGRLEEAKKDLLASIALDPTLSSYYNLAVLERISGKYQSCNDLLSQIIKKSPTYAQAYLQRGLCLAALGQHEAATHDMLRVLKLDPNNVMAMEQIGLSLASAGKYDAARTYLLKVSTIRLSMGQTAEYEKIMKIIAGLKSK